MRPDLIPEAEAQTKSIENLVKSHSSRKFPWFRKSTGGIFSDRTRKKLFMSHYC